MCKSWRISSLTSSRAIHQRLNLKFTFWSALTSQKQSIITTKPHRLMYVPVSVSVCASTDQQYFNLDLEEHQMCNTPWINYDLQIIVYGKEDSAPPILFRCYTPPNRRFSIEIRHNDNSHDKENSSIFNQFVEYHQRRATTGRYQHFFSRHRIATSHYVTVQQDSDVLQSGTHLEISSA